MGIGEIKGNKEKLDILIKIYKNDRSSLVPFIGAGFSMPVCPGWEAFLDEYFESAKETFMDLHERKAYKKAKESNTPDRLEKMADLLVECSKRRRFVEELRERLNIELPSDMKKKFSLLHEAFQFLKVTTNFDCLIEKNSSGKYVEVIKNIKVKEIDRIFSDRNVNALIKIHGCLNDPLSIILTRKQYTKQYGSKSSFKKGSPLPTILSSLFIHRSVIFIGCSLTTDRVLQVLKSLPYVAPHYAIVRSPSNDDQKVEIERHLSDCNITPLWIEEFHQIEEFFHELIESKKSHETKDSKPKTHEPSGIISTKIIKERENRQTNNLQPPIEKYVPLEPVKILESFLSEELIQDYTAEGVINALPYHNCGYLPIYYFMSMTQYSKQDVIEIIQSSRSTARGKKILLKNLNKTKEDFIRGDLKANGPRARKMREFKPAILNRTINLNHLSKLNPRYINYFLQTLTHLSREEYLAVKPFVHALLAEVLANHYKTSQGMEYTRYAICYLDYILYGNGALSTTPPTPTPTEEHTTNKGEDSTEERTPN